MKKIYSVMLRENLVVHGVLFTMLIFMIMIKQALAADYLEEALTLYFFACVMLMALKPYCLRNWSWLRTLPISRIDLLKVVLSEALSTLMLGAITICVIYLIAYQPDLQKWNFWRLIAGISSVSRQTWWFLTLIATVLSPFVISVGVRPALPQNLVDRNKAVLMFLVFPLAFAVGSYLSPLVMISVFLGLVLGWCGSFYLTAIFPARKFKIWALAYGILIFLSSLAILISFVELSIDSGARAAMRMKYYGILAPRLDRATLFSVLADPKLDEATRIEVAAFESSRSPKNKVISIEELREWSSRVQSNHLFLTGLVLFQRELWSPEALVHLEKEIQRRCGHRLQRSKWAPVWRCELESEVAGREKKWPLSLGLNIKNGPEVLNLLTFDHPLLASMLIQAASVDNNGLSWKPKVEALAKSNSPVISEQAQFWLDRLAANPKGTWMCQPSPRAKSSVCLESRIIPWGLKLESRIAGDPGAYISVSVQPGK